MSQIDLLMADPCYPSSVPGEYEAVVECLKNCVTAELQNWESRAEFGLKKGTSPLLNKQQK